MPKSVEEILALVPATLLRGHRDDTKFAPKLSFAERCEVMAFYLSGYKVPALAAAFGLHRRTVSSIVNRNARYYQDVTEEFDKRGRDDFVRTYLTEAGAMKLASVANSPEVKMNEPAYRGLKSTGDGPDKRKKSQEGTHTRDDGVRYEIAWKNEGEEDSEGAILVSGWFFRFLSDDFWTGQGNEGTDPFNSSQLAKDFATMAVAPKA